MGSPGWALLLLQLWGLQEAESLRVQQWPQWVNVTHGGEVTLSCWVMQSQAWERLRVEWVRANLVLCHLLISNGSLGPEGCGPRGHLSWRPPANLTLRLHHLSRNDSGDYVCRAILDIPTLLKAEGSGTQVLVEDAGGGQRKATSGLLGLLLVLPVAGAAVAASAALGAVRCGLRRCRREDPGDYLYCNVLYRPRETRRPEARPTEKAPDAAGEQRAQAVYSTASPRPAQRQHPLVPKPSPGARPGRPISAPCASPASPRR